MKPQVLPETLHNQVSIQQDILEVYLNLLTSPLRSTRQTQGLQDLQGSRAAQSSIVSQFRMIVRVFLLCSKVYILGWFAVYAEQLFGLLGPTARA